REPGLGFKVQRAALTALAIGALMASLSATSVAISGVADDGVAADENGNVVAVSPTGFAWAAGVRPGDVVVSIVGRDEPDGWRMVTRSADGEEHTADGRTASNGLAASMPVGI